MLIGLGPPSAGIKYPLKADDVTTIGRDAASDIVLAKRSLSRRHARIISDGTRFYLEDCDSTNGTFLNGHRIHERALLQDGDVVNVHDLPLAFCPADVSFFEDEPTAKSYPEGGAEPKDTEHTVPIYAGTPGASILQGRLDSLIAAARRLGSYLHPADLAQRVIDVLFEMFPQASFAEVYLVDDADELCSIAKRQSDEAGEAVHDDALRHVQMVQDVFASGQGVIHVSGGDETQTVAEGSAVSTICVPIAGATQRGLGVLVVETSDAAHRFGDPDLDLVSAVGILTGQAIGFARTHQLLLQFEQTQRHLQAAREIQLAMVSHTRPSVHGYCFADYYMPAEKVGGDYYFYETLPGGRVIVGIADASGKGLPAAMEIARFAGEVRFRIATSPTLKVAMARLNHFASQGGPVAFITCCVCVLDPEANTLTVANAGHLPPLRRRAGGGDIEPLATPEGGLPLGLEKKSICHPVTFPVEPGDRILLLTDGVVEAMNPQNELYGRDRLQQAMQTESKSLDVFVKAIVTDVDTFRQNRTASDDMCLVALERTSA